MAAALLNRDEILDRLLKVFRLHGFEGASLSILSRETGLGRSSLYHHFPNGKADMATAVLERASGLARTLVIEPLQQPGTPAERLLRMAQGLDRFYAGGQRSCLVNVFSLGDGGGPFREKLEYGLRRLMGAFSRLAEEAGVESAEAARRAEDAVIALHGALVVGRVLGQQDAFVRVLSELPLRLLRETLPPPPES